MAARAQLLHKESRVKDCARKKMAAVEKVANLEDKLQEARSHLAQEQAAMEEAARAVHTAKQTVEQIQGFITDAQRPPTLEPLAHLQTAVDAIATTDRDKLPMDAIKQLQEYLATLLQRREPTEEKQEQDAGQQSQQTSTTRQWQPQQPTTQIDIDEDDLTQTGWTQQPGAVHPKPRSRSRSPAGSTRSTPACSQDPRNRKLVGKRPKPEVKQQQKAEPPSS